jgi:DNA-binding MarR family transcriptional regulator
MRCMATVNRTDALVGRIARLDGDAGRREAVALGLVDGVLAGEGQTLAAALHALRDARARADGELAGWLDAATAFAHWGLERVPAEPAVAQGTQAHGFLRSLDRAQVGSTELRRLLEVDETQVSRTGRKLLESGLVTRRKVGREVFWQLTPRGERALEDATAPRRSSGAEFWQEAIRRGFEAVGGDEPGEPRQIDPTREHIIECTLALHSSRGIRATTRPEIAAKSAVPLEIVDSLFPTEDDLVRSCGVHLMESLRLPPVDRAPDVFADASSEHERIHRLVETFFGVYERGGAGITAGRHERRDVPIVDEALGQLDSTLDALVAEALRPLHLDGAAVASVRALTDLEVWRTLRDHGDTADAAVDQASTAVERWLAARP